MAALAPQIQRESKATKLLDYDHHLSVASGRKRAKSYPDEESSLSPTLPRVTSAAVSPSMSPPIKEEPDLEVST